MPIALKAALLSGLVFPGLGHFFLKKPVQGFIITLLATLCFYLLFSSIYAMAEQISLQIQQGQIDMDITSINSAVNQQSEQSQTAMMSYATWGLIILWLIGIIDSYRLGSQQDKNLDE